MKSPYTTYRNTIKLIDHIIKGLRSSVLTKLKQFLAFSALTLSLNVTSGGEVNQFDKEAYLNLNQEYTYSNQVATNQEDAVATFFTEIFSSIRSALGGTDSDNVDELGNKITSNLENKATSKVDGLINTKINELANSVGNGKTEISVHKLESNDPTYSIKTIQPITELNEDSTQLTFIQAQLNSGENHGERRDTINLGLGLRYLLEGGQSIAGINLFTDYETESKHKRASLGLEYQRANFSANVNKYFPLTDKKVISDYTEEALAGHDIKLTGQAPYLPWAKIKGTHYYWDAKVGDNIKGTILGVEVELNSSTTLEIGTENSNTAERASYARLSAQLPFKDGEALTNFKVADQAFASSNIKTLTDLDYVERSNKIRIEKLLNGVSVVLGEYNAPTVGATCTLYNSSGVAIANGSGDTTSTGSMDLSNIVLSAGLITMTCTGGTYTDKATGVVTNAPDLRAAKIYSGTGSFTLIASPLSEIAYQLADAGTLANDITTKNTDTATAFGLTGIDFTETIPTDLNTTTAANDDAGKFGTVLAAISQMGENSADANPTATITALVSDMNGGDGSSVNTIEGRNTGSETVDVLEAINNFENSNGDNNTANGSGSGNTGLAGSSTGEGSVKGGLSIIVISNYDGTGTAPTAQHYIDAGVTGVDASNLAEVNSQIASASSIDSDTTAEIQSIVDNTPGTATAANSIVTASPSSVAADGSTTSTITLQARDANNNNLSTGGLTVTMTESGSATLSSVTDNSDGTYTATITSTTAETVTVTAAFGGSNVTDTADVTFSALVMSASGIDYTAQVIGNQIWTTENMRHNATNGNTWSYNNDSANDAGGYGKLYDWTAAMEGSTTEKARGVCAAGWHVPSDDDWMTLEGALGMSVAQQEAHGWRGTEGTQLKTGGSSGFEAQLAGYRDTSGSFYYRGTTTDLWSSTESGNYAYRRNLNASDATVLRSTDDKARGFSVRCLKN